VFGEVFGEMALNQSSSNDFYRRLQRGKAATIIVLVLENSDIGNQEL
jgi:hypothetical protein